MQLDQASERGRLGAREKISRKITWIFRNIALLPSCSTRKCEATGPVTLDENFRYHRMGAKGHVPSLKNAEVR